MAEERWYGRVSVACLFVLVWDVCALRSALVILLSFDASSVSREGVGSKKSMLCPGGLHPDL